MKRLFSIFIGLIVLIPACKKEGQWKNLIKDDLSNWEVVNGEAPYTLNNGEITGSTVLKSLNSFLCTKEKYSDFILEFDVLVDSSLNSGVQIRSHFDPEYCDGRVFGYQIELESSPRAWAGGIFDERRRGWLYPITDTVAQKAFKINDWNHFRVEAYGNSIRTWKNGVPCADIIDDMDSEGFIGLQIHAIGNDSSKVGEKAIWKNIRILTKDVEKYLSPNEPLIEQKSFLVNRLSDREKNEGWKLLWDGKTTNGWRGARLNEFPASGWEIKDSALTVLESGGELCGGGGDIVTIDKYKNFELRIDFRYDPGANSGIKYLVNPEIDGKKGSTPGCEYQIIDDISNPDAKLGIDGNRRLASLYDILPVKKEKTVMKNGLWNRAIITVDGNNVKHYLNGVILIEYNRGDAKWKELVSKSIFKDIPDFGNAEEGHILLQDHGNRVSFRSIKIKEIKD